ncbi:MAG: hypothetical protein AAB919_03070 [Patescibacteria group bacterium]
MISRRMLLVGAASVPVAALPLPGAIEAQELNGRMIGRFDHHVTLWFDGGTRAQYNDYNVEQVGENLYKVKLGARPIHVFPRPRAA